MSWKDFKSGTKFFVGFGILIFITAVLAGVAVKNMIKINRESKILDAEYMPEVKSAANLHEEVNRTMFEMRGSQFTQKESFYKNVLKEIEAIKNSISQGEDLSKQEKRLAKLTEELKIAKTMTDNYINLVNQTVEINNKVASEQGKTNKSTAKNLDNYEKYFKSQSNHSNLYHLISMRKIKQSIYDLREAKLRSQTAHNPKILVDALADFSGLNELINDLRRSTQEIKDWQSFALVSESGKQYQSAVENSGKLLEEGDKSSGQRDQTGQKLISSAISTASSAIDNNRQATETTTKLLHASGITIIVGLILALIISIIFVVMLFHNNITSSMVKKTEYTKHQSEGELWATIQMN